MCNYEHFSIFFLLFKSFVNIELSYVCFHNKYVHYSSKLHRKVNYLIKQVIFLLLGIIRVPPIILDR